MEIALFIDEIDSYLGKNLAAYSFSWGCKNNGIEKSMDLINKFIEHNQEIAYLYFGSEFCEYLIPSENDVVKFVDICIKEKITPVFVTPPVSEFGLKMVKNCIDCLINYSIESEIVVNDVGILELLSSYQKKPKICLGRVFDKTSHEPRATKQELELYYGNSGLKYARSAGITTSSSRSVFNYYGVERFEFDLPKTGLKLDVNGNYSLYWPYQYMTTGRVCLMRANNYSNNNKFLVGNEICNKVCKNIQIEKRKPINGYIFENGEKLSDQYIFQRGNTLFYVHTNDVREVELQQYNRLVLQL